MPGYKGCSTYFPGPFNSLNFDGVDHYVSTTIPTSIFTGTNSFTISLWVKSVYSSGNGARCIFSTRDFDGSDGTSGFSLFAPGYVRGDNDVVMDIWET